MNFKIKVTASSSKVIGFQKHASAHLPLMVNMKTEFGDIRSITQDAVGATRISISRSLLQG